MFSWRILLLIVYASSITDGALRIVPIYATFNVAEGASASVTCTNLNSQTGEQPQWINPYNQPIGTYGGGGSLDMYVVHSTDPETAQKVTRLQINNIIESWAGGYDCQANGDAESININVFKQVSFPFEAAEKQQVLIYHEAGNLDCTMEGDPDTIVDWLGPNGPILNGGRFLITPMYGLTIDNVTLDDEGDYICQGTVPNVGASENLRIFADVQVKPRISYPPINKNATEGTSAFFTCEAIGEPQPEYTWFDGTVELNDGVKYIVQEEGRRLMITDLQEDDEKRYTCHVENEAGFDRRDGELTVDIPPTPTRAVTLEREEGQTVMFFCDIQRGDQEHLVLQWKRFEKWLPMGVQVDSRITIQDESGSGTGNPGSISLTIDGIHRGDEGPYTCFARNNGGYAAVDSMLNVRYAPIINLDYTPGKVYSWVGRQINMTCHWYGFPIPSVRWYVNSQPLYGTVGDVAGNATIYDFRNGSSTLYVDTGVNDFLPYQCQGRNKYGNALHRIQFERAYTMKKPTNIQALETTSTTIKVTFDDPVEVGADYPEYLRILGYVVAYGVFGQPNQQYQEFQDLCQPTEFQCGRLCVEKERRCDGLMDCLDNSDEINCNPDDDCPGGFKCPVRDGGVNPCIPLAYVCDKFSDCVDGADESEESCNSFYRPMIADVIVTGLRPDRIYQFRVAVINQVGWGEWSVNQTERTLGYGPPGESQIFEREPDRDTMYEIVWIEPYDDGGSPINAYEIVYSQVSGPDVNEIGLDPVKIPADKDSDTAPIHRYLLTNLKPGTYYYLELYAESTWGKSAPTTLRFRMKGGAPIQPVTDTPIGPGLRIGELPISAFIGILVGGFFILLLFIDCLCYCTNRCGLTMCICVHMCGKESPEEEEMQQAVEYGRTASSIGERMKMERLAEVETEINYLEYPRDGASSQYQSLPASQFADDRWKMPTHATYEADRLMQGQLQESDSRTPSEIHLQELQMRKLGHYDYEGSHYGGSHYSGSQYDGSRC
ncbi:fasciclin-2-like isoform X2 [Asterias rubens]|uniref:fasciclin-2-like isoform X2 n=1 Tax=Asterias rubens TaxID=7604 RepID=UPI001455138D|nr:fasciclin-2-like isoform X2 [Asterias rubens]